jgi:hypothetical protein
VMFDLAPVASMLITAFIPRNVIRPAGPAAFRAMFAPQ